MAAIPNYIEDVFSTYLYTGTGASQTITNGIDTTTYGGLTWIKGRSGATGHRLTDTARGVTKSLASNSTAAEATETTGLTAFGTTGFTIGADADYNTSAATYASWTFREQPKFFDIVTWTGDGISGKTIAHNLGSVPGCIIVKKLTGAASNWPVYHRSLNGGVTPQNYYLYLSSTDGTNSSPSSWNDTAPTSTNFTVGNAANVNGSGETFVAYLFAHDAGGFGLAGTDNVISCGSFTSDASSKYSVTLGYEPQWLMVKRSDGIGPWYLMDSMRTFTTPTPTTYNSNFEANTSGAEDPTGYFGGPTATGFADLNGGTGANRNFIYIAIRRGPMKVPTDATKVFSPIATSIGSGKLTTGFPVDAQFMFYRTGGLSTRVATRLTGVATLPVNGVGNYLQTASTAAEVSGSSSTRYWDNTGFEMPSDWGSSSMIFESFQRAPGFFDEVCYTGNGGYVSRNHNLAAVPEMMIVKARSTAGYNWAVYVSTLGFESYMRLNTAGAPSTTGNFWYQTPTATQFSTGAYADIEEVGVTYVNYLFATCAGVSKVGSYTGTGATQTIACGFTAGARFVLIKRTDSTGDWYVWDSARGMVSGTDPSLLLNSTAAEVNANSIYAITTGFQIVSTAAGINANGGSYIFLAIA